AFLAIDRRDGLTQLVEVAQEARHCTGGGTFAVGAVEAARHRITGRQGCAVVCSVGVAIDFIPAVPAATQWLPPKLAIADRAPLLFGEPHPVAQETRVRRK